MKFRIPKDENELDDLHIGILAAVVYLDEGLIDNALQRLESVKSLCTNISARRNLLEDTQKIAVTFLTRLTTRNSITPKASQDFTAAGLLDILGEPKIRGGYTMEQLIWAEKILQQEVVPYLANLVQKDMEVEADPDEELQMMITKDTKC